jgi:hypothetical protein
MTSYWKSMRSLIVLAAFTAGPAFASDPAPSEAGSRGPTVEVKQAADTKKGAPTKEQSQAEHAGCVCVGLQAPLVPDYGG